MERLAATAAILIPALASFPLALALGWLCLRGQLALMPARNRDEAGWDLRA